MPIINDRYYASPQYGRGLESARAADAESRRMHGEEEPSWLDHFLGLVPAAAEKQRDAKPDRVEAQLKDDNRTDRAAMSYSEKTHGTVAEHEAMQSTVMNRVASGERQYVDTGNLVNEYNVIHAPHQYQGVTKPDFLKYKSGTTNNPDAQNAVKADENLKRTGKPTNDATFFIVNHGGKPPTAKQVHSLGNVTPAGHVGDVYLYKPKPPATRH